MRAYANFFLAQAFVINYLSARTCGVPWPRALCSICRISTFMHAWVQANRRQPRKRRGRRRKGSGKPRLIVFAAFASFCSFPGAHFGGTIRYLCPLIVKRFDPVPPSMARRNTHPATGRTLAQ